MDSEENRTTGQGQRKTSAERYQPALAYVELDRAHRKRSRWSTILVVSVVVLVASLAMLGVIGFSYLQGQMKNNEIAENADLTDIAQDFAGNGVRIDWDALKALNPDTVGWLYVPGTSINYPVVHGQDNDYYLSHDFTGDQGWLAQFGSIFLDWRNNPDWSDQAYFIYGHHMNDGSMFAGIAGLADQERFDASRTVYLLSPNGNFRLKTFSLVHCASDDPLVQISFSNSQEFASYVQDKMNRSIVSVTDVLAADDITKLFAFATCDNYSSGRYVLYAYIEQEVGGVNAASSAAVESGGAAGRIDDLPAEGSEGVGSARSSGQSDQASSVAAEDAAKTADFEAEEEAASDERAQGDEEALADGYGDYAGGYYTYDSDGDLVWVPTEDE